MADPRCPSRAVEGIRHIVGADRGQRARDGKPWFRVVHGDASGYVDGVPAKHVCSRGGGTRLVLRERD